MKRVSHLESINSISTFSFDLSAHLLRGHSVLVKAILLKDFSDAVKSLSSNEKVSLSHNSFNLVVLITQSSKNSCTNFFLSVFKESRFLDHSQNLIGKCWASQSDFFLVLEFSLLLSGHILGDWDREQFLMSYTISNGLHLHNFKKLHFVHEISQRISPSLSDGLEIFHLFHTDFNAWKAFDFLSFIFSDGLV